MFTQMLKVNCKRLELEKHKSFKFLNVLGLITRPLDLGIGLLAFTATAVYFPAAMVYDYGNWAVSKALQKDYTPLEMYTHQKLNSLIFTGFSVLAVLDDVGTGIIRELLTPFLASMLLSKTLQILLRIFTIDIQIFL
jgi:hypothetical protein